MVRHAGTPPTGATLGGSDPRPAGPPCPGCGATLTVPAWVKGRGAAWDCPRGCGWAGPRQL